MGLQDLYAQPPQILRSVRSDLRTKFHLRMTMLQSFGITASKV